MEQDRASDVLAHQHELAGTAAGELRDGGEPHRGHEDPAGPRVGARLDRKEYQKGEKISDALMQQIRLEPHKTCPQWNYTIRPNG